MLRRLFRDLRPFGRLLTQRFPLRWALSISAKWRRSFAGCEHRPGDMPNVLRRSIVPMEVATTTFAAPKPSYRPFSRMVGRVEKSFFLRPAARSSEGCSELVDEHDGEALLHRPSDPRKERQSAWASSEAPVVPSVADEDPRRHFVYSGGPEEKFGYRGIERLLLPLRFEIHRGRLQEPGPLKATKKMSGCHVELNGGLLLSHCLTTERSFFRQEGFHRRSALQNPWQFALAGWHSVFLP